MPLSDDDLDALALIGHDTNGAVDDLNIVTGTHPHRPDLTGVFLQNTNPNRGIVASIRVTAASQLSVQSSIDGTLRRRWPLQFEVRVAPGASVVIGLEDFPLWQFVDFSAPDASSMLNIVQLRQTFIIQGAYYKSAPFPPLNEDPEFFLSHYDVPIIHSANFRYFPLSMNLHPTRVIEMVRYTISVGTDKQQYGNTGVVGGLQIYHQPQNAPFNLRVQSANFST